MLVCRLLALSSLGENASERVVAVSDAEYVTGIVIFLVTLLELDDVNLRGRLRVLDVYVNGALPWRVVPVMVVNNASLDYSSRVMTTVSPDCRFVGVTVIENDS